MKINYEEKYLDDGMCYKTHIHPHTCTRSLTHARTHTHTEFQIRASGTAGKRKEKKKPKYLKNIPFPAGLSGWNSLNV